MLDFVLGFVLSLLLILSICLESTESVRMLFSIFFLIGIFGLAFELFNAGMLLKPLFIAGVVVNLIFFIIMIPIIVSEGDKKDNGKRD